ncbi:phage shock envelope stress response protein PspM [Tsukamurella soli]|uniref:phage shock envelope stress response protein PspM n=1 Tax=Tsukamurella soli TaxID=644556 RepID=UPI00361F70EE
MLAVPTVVAARRLRRLKAAPVPPRGYARRDLPRTSSAAYGPARRLADAEQEFLALMSVLARTRALPAEAIRDLDDAADSSADAVVRYAVQLQHLEAAARAGVRGPSGPVLGASLDAGLRRLAEGVDAYLDMVRSAAATVAAAHGAALGRPGVGADAIDAAVPQLRDTADRLQAWAYGIAALPPVPHPQIW